MQVWLLWQKARALHLQPSSILGIDDPYVAYCLDEAVIFFGLRLESMLEEATNPTPSKEERQAKDAQDRVLRQVFGDEINIAPKKFADPALMFSQE